MCEIGSSSWFYYKENCYDIRSHECKIIVYNLHLTEILLKVLL
jgi:hypothetical protein